MQIREWEGKLSSQHGKDFRDLCQHPTFATKCSADRATYNHGNNFIGGLKWAVARVYVYWGAAAPKNQPM